MNVIEKIDLCDKIISVMQTQGFSSSAIEHFKNSEHFKRAIGQPPMVQKAALIMALGRLLTKGPDIAPVQIRVHLNVATNMNDWLKDISLVVIPFLKLNEDKFLTFQ